ncbi:zinc-finger domain-containing protein [Pollutimonas sp. H1-120]|uniref:zinc-finger domain-containing protein n=1 Tax=Pollutimonas sp. H1-120 TaxID=3148824 RepID=UPI003B51773F
MSSAPTSAVPKDETIFVEAKDLPLYCPGPKAPLWSMHPRIYIEVVKTGKAVCQYCGASYQLKEGEKVHGH